MMRRDDNLTARLAQRAREARLDTDAAWSALCALGASATRLESTFDADKRLVWRRWGKTGRSVVLVHGGGGSWTHWADTIPALATHYRVWVPDLPGNGDSDMPVGEQTYASIAGFVVDGIEQLIPDDQPIDVVGFSYGSMLSSLAVLQLGRRVRKLVLVGSNFVHPINPRFKIVNWRKAATPEARDAAIRFNLLAIMIGHAEHIDEYVMRIQRENLARQRLSPLSLGPPGTVIDLIPRFPAQLQIEAISGADDFLAPGVMHRQAECLAALWPGASFHVIENAGHWVMREAPEGFNRVLLEALAR